jgi:hypothetical protein
MTDNKGTTIHTITLGFILFTAKTFKQGVITNINQHQYLRHYAAIFSA